MTKKPVIRIEYADWLEEYLRNETPINDDDDIVALLTADAHSTAEVARMTIVAREQGYAADTILPPNKTMLAADARARLAVKMKARRVSVEMPNGTEYSVREFVGVPQTGPTSDEQQGNAMDVGAIELQSEKAFVPFQDEAALERIMYYLNNNVPGIIFERLKLIAAGGGDVLRAGEQLKATIDEMVGRLV